MLEINMYTGGIAATNGYACNVNGTSFVVDAPEGILPWMESVRFEPQAMLLTHAHFDHVMDASKIQEKWGLPTYAFAHPTAELTLEAMLGAFGPSLKIPTYQVDCLVGEVANFDILGLTFEILHVPGHSVDSLAFIPENTGVIFGGDVLMRGGIGRSDLPGGDSELLFKGIREKLYVLDDSFVVHSGHGPATTIGEEKQSNPYVRG